MTGKTPDQVHRSHFWILDPKITYLNHGSFGACPRPVLVEQGRLRRLMETEPVQFLWRDLEGRLDGARHALARFLACKDEDLVFLPNATTGVNTVLRGLPLGPGDEILALEHGYQACLNAAAFVAEKVGARLVKARIPFPVESARSAREVILAAATPRTKIALLDHVTSPTGLVLPIPELVRDLAARGIDTLVDGAHAPGMIPLDLDRIGAAYYTGNLHKWVCAPKGAAFLHVRADRRHLVRPLSISHGAGSRRTDRSRFLLEFDWPGTDDPTPFLAVPAALNFLSHLWLGGIDELMARNRALVIEARRLLCERLGLTPPCPEEMLGSLASLIIPEGPPEDEPTSPLLIDGLQERLFNRHRIEVPVMNFPAWPARIIRISAQAYNTPDHYSRLADALETEFG